MSIKKSVIQFLTTAAALLVCLAALCPLTAFAADNKADITDETFNVDVDIAWGEMSFTYTPAHNLWNPATHAYDATAPAEWTAQSNHITVTNFGPAVRADFAATVSESISGVTAGFKTADSEEVSESLSVELAEAQTGTNPSTTVYLTFSGAISGNVESLATVTVTIIAK